MNPIDLLKVNVNDHTEKKKLEIMAHYQKSVTDINDRISKLQALEWTT